MIFTVCDSDLIGSHKNRTKNQLRVEKFTISVESSAGSSNGDRVEGETAEQSVQFSLIRIEQCYLMIVREIATHMAERVAAESGNIAEQ